MLFCARYTLHPQVSNKANMCHRPSVPFHVSPTVHARVDVFVPSQLWTNPFDVGCKGNWQQVFGSQPFLVALLPSRRPPPPPVVAFFPLEEEDQRHRYSDVSKNLFLVLFASEKLTIHILTLVEPSAHGAPRFGTSSCEGGRTHTPRPPACPYFRLPTSTAQRFVMFV